MRRIFMVCLFVLMFAGFAQAAPVNLVTNGDFSQGATGFNTQYTRNTISGWGEGVYDVRPNADEAWHPYFVNNGDHTSGTGNFMAVNGVASMVGGPGFTSLVWEQTITGLESNTSYFFEAFLMNLCCKEGTPTGGFPGADLYFYANGVLLGSGGSSLAGIWTGISTTWFSASNTAVNLQILNRSSIFNGNDFGLDDLFLGTESSLTPTPEPASMLLLGTGLLGVGRYGRRRLGHRRK